MLDAADNSGAAACSASRCSAVRVVVTPASATSSRSAVKDAIPRGKVKKGEVYNAVVVRTRKVCAATTAYAIRFDGNAAVILNNKTRADRHPHLRAGHARAAQEEVHEDHLARAGSAVRRWQR